ncbi:diadenylate cyclase CdaA [Geobacter pelophilus]|jgi:uncharacterized protein (TIGR00159 family)|uniref:Diadenylate cyclase n=1 Tax=Geoanaerobacter pelophilus TaxID=60036 RepID=A0AAW4L989_9BACT|nr:diadenylate cyclase CdaA [Geoanaerobacter pelophilus]MBT0664599.1 diadenylate cyclase CdaA [Geoanaerobacter pelophilus]
MTETLGGFSWLLHLLDIMLVSVLIYHFLLLLRGGGMALRLLLWLAVAFLVYLGASFIGLESLGWLLDNFFSVSLLIVAIIFQHDIRRALVSLSRDRDRQLSREDDTSELIDELVTAVDSLSARQIGALIVLERGMSLDNFLAVGTDIDAKVTSELITSIFLPYSPIHDGAVIIQGGKLTKAGCFLPLSQNHELGKSLGTRHRAAIGLTEIVDAVVIIVSEETGRIAIAGNGKIHEDIPLATIRKELKRHLTSRRAL